MESSLITFNGIDTSNYAHALYPKLDHGFIMEKNLISDGKWLIKMQDAHIGNEHMFKEFQGTGCNAVIATALNSIKMPFDDF